MSALRADFSLGGEKSGLKILSNHVYLADGSAGLKMIDVLGATSAILTLSNLGFDHEG